MDRTCWKPARMVSGYETVPCLSFTIFFELALFTNAVQGIRGDSPDFVLLGTLDGRPIVAVIELKCRSLVKTLNAERRRLGYGEFESISCDSPLLRKYLLKRDESFAMCASCKYFVG